MNLSDLSDFVCTKISQTDDDSKAACKRFLNNRYKFIWGDALWRDSLYQFNINLIIDSGSTADVHNHYSFNTEGHYLLPRFADRVLAIRTTNGQLSVDNAEMAFAVDPDIFNNTGDPISFQILSPCVWIHTTAAPIYASTSSAADDGITVRVTGIDEYGERFTDSISNIIYPTDYPTRNCLIVERITKPVTNGDVEIYSIYSGPTSETFATISSTDTQVQPKLHIRVLPKPREEVSYKVLIKKKPLELSNDYDEPELRGVDNALIAYAQGDMLERERQYAKAAEKFQEGNAMLAQLKQVNAHQEASHIRYVPWTDVTEDPWATPLI